MALQAAPSWPDCGAPVGSDGICAACVSRETAVIDQGVTHPSSAAGIDVPASIGPYKILRVLGEGGMGVVYLAEQAEPFRREVAVKVIKVGMDTREVVARFEAERQALALMSHSHIAQIYEAGATRGPRSTGVRRG
jgi:serine/threonine protein kinase